MRVPHRSRSLDRLCDVLLHKNCSGSGARNSEKHVLNLNNTNIALNSHLDGHIRIVNILELLSCCHDLRLSLSDDAGADRNLQYILNYV